MSNLTIKEIITERNKIHEKFTNAVTKKLNNVFSAVSIVGGQDCYPILWTTIDMMDEDTLFLMGTQPMPDPDEPTFDENGDPNIIERIIRIALPLNMAETGSVDEIVDFFKDHLSFEDMRPDNHGFQTDDLTEEQKEKFSQFSHTYEDNKKPN